METGKVDVKFIVPESYVKLISDIVEDVCLQADFTLWMESCEPLPSQILKAYRKRRNFTQKKLSKMTGIPSFYIHRMEHNLMPIPEDFAEKLSISLAVPKYKLLSNNE